MYCSLFCRLRRTLVLIPLLLLQANLIIAQNRLPPVDTLLYRLAHPVNDSLTFLDLVYLTEQMQFQNPRQGLRYAERALDMPIAEGDTMRMLEILSRKAGCYAHLSVYDSAVMTNKRALRMALAGKQAMHTLHAANQYAILSNVYSEYGKLDSALYYNEQALAMYTKLEKPIYQAITYNNGGILYEKQGLYARSIEEYFNALSIFEDKGFEGGSAAVLANLGTGYFKQQEYEKAINFCRRSIVLKRKLEDLFGLSSNYSRLGEIYLAMGEADSAVFYNQQAIELKAQIEDKRGIATIQLQLGRMYLEKKAFREAASYLLPSYQLADSIGDQQLRSMAGVYLAKLHQQEGNDVAVNRYLSEALQYAEGAGARELLAEVLEGYYQFYRSKQDFRAFEFQDRYQVLSDSLRNDSIVQAFTRNELEYEFENEKRQIALDQAQQEAELQQKIERQQLIGIFTALGALALGIILLLLWRSHRLQQRSNQQLNAQNQTIQKSLEEREILLQEIHHRVKNNLQVISSLLGLQSRSIDDPNALEAISESRNRVRSMALIHQNLYQDAQLTSVSLPGYIEQLSQSLLDSYQIEASQIKLRQEVDDIALDVDILIPLGLILNELISNALKHAFGERQHGQIDISIVEVEEGIRVEIADDGAGLPADFEQQSSQSLGFKLIRAFVRKMNASLDIKGESGTKVALHIPTLQITS